MGMFDFTKVCLFSEVDGIVTISGQPIRGAEVIRTAQFRGETFRDETTTDEHGRYRFPAKFVRSLYKIAPIEPYIEQKIVIVREGKEYVAWEGDKRNYDINGEIKKPISLTCDLAQKSERNEFGARVIWSFCKIN